MEETPTPYVKGARFTIHRHVPPKPTPSEYHYCEPKDIEEYEQMTFIERCLIHPLLPGTTLLSEPVSITINEEIVGLATSGARILEVNDNLVAKIYDPFYYDTPTSWNFVATNPFRLADHDYSHEAAAYERVSGGLGGTVVPEFYGSYTCDLPVVSSSESHSARSVRLILIERVLGTCMRDLEPSRMHTLQHQRANIMAKIVDAESLVFACGVIHGDMHPRNIIICGHDFEDARLRVVLIDFGSSRLDNRNLVGSSGLPISPLLRWDARRHRHESFRALGWVDWDWQPWLEQCWSGSEAYAPITDDSRDRWLGLYDRRLHARSR